MKFLSSEVVRAGRKVIRSFYYLIALVALIILVALHAADRLWAQLDSVYERQTRFHQPMVGHTTRMQMETIRFLLEKGISTTAGGDLPTSGSGMDVKELLLVIDRNLQMIRESTRQFPAFEMRFDSVLSRAERALAIARSGISPGSGSIVSRDQAGVSVARIQDALLPLELPLQQLRIFAELSNDNALSMIKELQADARNLWALTAGVFVFIAIVIGVLLVRQLHRNLRELESATEAKSTFVATVSHEIRTPLNAICGGLGLLSAENLSNEDREMLRVMQGSSEVLLSLVNDVLDFAKIDAGKLSVDPVQIRIAGLLDEVVKMMTVRAFDYETHVSIIVHPRTNREVVADGGHLRQILINLVGNAIKFTPTGHVTLRLLPAPDSRLRFEVEDDGPGIPEHRQRELFMEFERMDPSADERRGGAGLGLAISKRFVQLLGGRIGVSSEVGRGSTFWFEVPCEVPEPELRQPGGHGEFDGLSLLIVGSRAHWRTAMAEQFELWGISARCVTWEEIDDGARPQVAELGQARFDLIIMGGRPKGYAVLPEALQALRRRGTKLVSFARTFGLIQLHDTQADLADYLLSLPVTNESLWRCVSEMTGRAVHRQPPISSFAAKKVRPAASVAGVRILLAEDGRANRMVAVAMLRNLGYHVDSVATGREAAAAASSLPYDVILMDISMPDMDGLEATRRIRRLPGSQGEVPIIAVTADTASETSQACLEAGMCSFITKPIDPTDLSARIEECVLTVCGEAESEAEPAAELRIESATLERIDRHAISRLEKDTSSDMLPRMVESFVDEINCQARAIAIALDAGELPVLAKESHVLKSSAGLFGAQFVCTLATDLNRACREDNRADAVKLASMLVDEIAVSAATLRQEYLPTAAQH